MRNRFWHLSLLCAATTSTATATAAAAAKSSATASATEQNPGSRNNCENEHDMSPRCRNATRSPRPKLSTESTSDHNPLSEDSSDGSLEIPAGITKIIGGVNPARHSNDRPKDKPPPDEGPSGDRPWYEQQDGDANGGYLKAFLTNRPSLQTLSAGQQSSLAQLVHLTVETSLTGDRDADEAAERACVHDLVRITDGTFTLVSSKETRSMMWSADDGITREAADALLASLSDKLSQVSLRASCAAAGWDQTEQSTCLHRIATALTRACLTGRHANFKVTESTADQLLRVFGGSDASSDYGLLLVLVLAAAGAVVLMDWLVLSRVFAAPTAGTTLIDHVPCQCRLCLETVIKGSTIGQGGFGEVFTCKVKGKGAMLHVMKMIRVDLEYDVNVLQDALDEASHLVTLSHPNIVEYRDVFVHRDLSAKLQDRTDASNRPRGFSWLTALGSDSWRVNQETSRRRGSGDYVCIVMEYCSEGTLLDYITKGVPLPLDVLVATLYQIVSAVAYVHASDIVHFDIKLENIFIARATGAGGSVSSLIKVGDFGLAMRKTPEQQKPLLRSKSPVPGGGPSSPFSLSDELQDQIHGSSRGVESALAMDRQSAWSSAHVAGTAPYQPPECFHAGHAAVGPAVDVWALGCALYEAVTCQSVPTAPPFLGQLALSREEWPAMLSSLQKMFSENLQSMTACALADKQLEAASRERLVLNEARHGLEELLVELLEPDPSNRPALEDLLDRPWLQMLKSYPLRFGPLSVQAEAGQSQNPVRSLFGDESRVTTPTAADSNNDSSSTEGGGTENNNSSSSSNNTKQETTAPLTPNMILRAKSMRLFPRPKLLDDDVLRLMDSRNRLASVTNRAGLSPTKLLPRDAFSPSPMSSSSSASLRSDDVETVTTASSSSQGRHSSEATCEYEEKHVPKQAQQDMMRRRRQTRGAIHSLPQIR